MNKELTQKEIEKIQNLCFSNPAKSCAIAQIIIDTCQVMSCSTFADLGNKSKRTVQYQAKRLIGINIDGRKYISLVQ